MQQAEGLMRPGIHRHLTANEVGAYSRNFNTQHALDGAVAEFVDLRQVCLSLADVFVQDWITSPVKSAQAYHRGAQSAKMGRY